MFAESTYVVAPRVLLGALLASLIVGCASGDRPLVFAGDSPQPPVEITEPGYVIVRYDVGVDGVVRNAAVVSAHPDSRYAAHALAVVSGWRFQPARRDNVPIVSRGVQSRITFSLEASEALGK